jgi:hypothetical protein
VGVVSKIRAEGLILPAYSVDARVDSRDVSGFKRRSARSSPAEDGPSGSVSRRGVDVWQTRAIARIKDSLENGHPSRERAAVNDKTTPQRPTVKPG